jgi:hypothetical protein
LAVLEKQIITWPLQASSHSLIDFETRSPSPDISGIQERLLLEAEIGSMEQTRLAVTLRDSRDVYAVRAPPARRVVRTALRR